jgi:hypothetical protein
MALLGVILLLAGIGAGIYAYVGTHAVTTTTTVSALGFSREATPLELVVLGALAMLLFAVGWALLSASARRRARARRLEREGSHVEQLEERAESERLEHERRFEEAGLRDEDLRRRENELAARHEGLNQREAELVQRERETRPVIDDDPAYSPDTARGADDERTEWVRQAPADSASQADEPPARPADARQRPHDAPHQTV